MASIPEVISDPGLGGEFTSVFRTRPVVSPEISSEYPLRPSSMELSFFDMSLVTLSLKVGGYLLCQTEAHLSF